MYPNLCVSVVKQIDPMSLLLELQKFDLKCFDDHRKNKLRVYKSNPVLKKKFQEHSDNQRLIMIDQHKKNKLDCPYTWKNVIVHLNYVRRLRENDYYL